MVIDLQEKMKKRFYRWAAEYIKATDITQYHPSQLLVFLVEKKVFTFEEIRTELDERKIILHEDYFDLAKEIWKKCQEESEVSE